MHPDKIKSFHDLHILCTGLLNIQPQLIDTKAPNTWQDYFKILYQLKKACTSSFPHNDLFRKQDILQPEEKLKEQNGKLFFLTENSGNWCLYIKPAENPVNVYLHDTAEVFGKNEEIISESLSDFLITYTLQELVFAMKYIANSTENNFVAKETFTELMPLWTGKRYVVKDAQYNFYLLDNDSLFMDADGLQFFATNNLQKLRHHCSFAINNIL